MRLLALLCVVSLGLAGCGQSNTPGTSGNAQAPSTPAATADAAWRLASAPEGAVDVGALKKTASEGDQVVIRGRIGGHRDPMTSGSAVFLVMDPAVPTCADIPGDTCPRPWDYCCEPAESKVANNATVQLVDDAGLPRAIDLQEHGLAPMDVVVAVGIVGARPTPEVLVIKAEKIYKEGT